VRAALEEAVGALGRGQTGLVFTSGGVIAAVCMLVMGLPEESFVTFNRTSVNASVTKLIIGGSGTSLVTFNEHAHLEPDLVTYR
jgi:broad specificity phosphatase PhoE